MEDELLPESVRGGWYFIPAEAELDEAVGESAEVLVFRLDETYERFELTESGRERDETGGYTFDGRFLIVRGGNTNTYRVEPETGWRWELEGKKEDWLLLRGWTDRTEPLELAEDRVRAIEKVPARVFVRSEFDGPETGEICSLVHESDEGELKLGACFAETGDEGVEWVLLTPFTTSMSEKLWRRIVRRSYLDIYRDDDSGDVPIDIVV